MADHVTQNRALRNALIESAARQVSDVRAGEVIGSVEAMIALFRRYLLVGASSAYLNSLVTAAAVEGKAASFAMTARTS